jgi:Icc-related predicted phosphoesterase
MASTYYVAFGDVHESTANLPRIAELPGAAGVIITGDLTNCGCTEPAKKIMSEIADINPRIMGQIGNMDTISVESVLEEMGTNIHLQAVELAPGVGLMGVGYSTPTPFSTPSEVPDATMGQWLDQTYEKAKNFKELVLCVHTPPVNTCADRIDSGAHVGSPAVRAFIERVQPAVCLTGHIHESVCSESLGATQVVNPGAMAAGGYVLLHIEDGKARAELKFVG